MTQTMSWSCPACGWLIGQVRDGDLHLYSQAVAGSGQGETPLVLAVVRTIHRTPVRCTHCGHVEVWDANLRRLAGMLERSLGRPLNDNERRRMAGEITDGMPENPPEKLKKARPASRLSKSRPV